MARGRATGGKGTRSSATRSGTSTSAAVAAVGCPCCGLSLLDMHLVQSRNTSLLFMSILVCLTHAQARGPSPMAICAWATTW